MTLAEQERARVVAGRINKIGAEFLRRVCHGLDVACPDRPEDRQRQKLRRAGAVRFNRDAWQWEATDFGFDLLNAIERGEHLKGDE